MAWQVCPNPEWMERQLNASVSLVAAPEAWEVWDGSNLIDEGSGGGSLLDAMEAADEWAYEQGYRPERSEGER